MIPQVNGAGKPYPKISKHTPIYLGYGNTVSGDVLCKDAHGSQHMLRTPRAWCFDRSILKAASAAGATRAEIYDCETHTTYTATLETIDRYGFNVQRGHNDQVGLRLDHWSINGATPVAEQRAAQTNQEREDLQMSLFGEAG